MDYLQPERETRETPPGTEPREAAREVVAERFEAKRRVEGSGIQPRRGDTACFTGVRPEFRSPVGKYDIDI
jgi:hypothetical protein